MLIPENNLSSAFIIDAVVAFTSISTPSLFLYPSPVSLSPVLISYVYVLIALSRVEYVEQETAAEIAAYFQLELDIWECKFVQVLAFALIKSLAYFNIY